MGQDLENGKRIAVIHQPEFIPWLGFFNKLNQGDIFVILDDVQFKKNHFENRNKIRCNNAQGWAWISIPVLTKHKHGQKIKDVEISGRNNRRWKEKILNTVCMSYRKTPYFEDVYELISVSINNDCQKIVEINIGLLMAILDYLGIEKTIYIQSRMGVTSTKSRLIIDLVQATGASIYLSGQSGKTYLEQSKFQEKGLTVQYQQFTHPEYTQSHGGFIKGLSIIDLLFNHGKNSIHFIGETNRE